MNSQQPSLPSFPAPSNQHAPPSFADFSFSIIGRPPTLQERLGFGPRPFVRSQPNLPPASVSPSLSTTEATTVAKIGAASAPIDDARQSETNSPDGPPVQASDIQSEQPAPIDTSRGSPKERSSSPDIWTYAAMVQNEWATVERPLPSTATDQTEANLEQGRIESEEIQKPPNTTNCQKPGRDDPIETANLGTQQGNHLHDSPVAFTSNLVKKEEDAVPVKEEALPPFFLTGTDDKSTVKKEEPTEKPMHDFVTKEPLSVDNFPRSADRLLSAVGSSSVPRNDESHHTNSTQMEIDKTQDYPTENSPNISNSIRPDALGSFSTTQTLADDNSMQLETSLPPPALTLPLVTQVSTPGRSPTGSLPPVGDRIHRELPSSHGNNPPSRRSDTHNTRSTGLGLLSNPPSHDDRARNHDGRETRSFPNHNDGSSCLLPPLRRRSPPPLLPDLRDSDSHQQRDSYRIPADCYRPTPVTSPTRASSNSTSRPVSSRVPTRDSPPHSTRRYPTTPTRYRSRSRSPVSRRVSGPFWDEHRPGPRYHARSRSRSPRRWSGSAAHSPARHAPYDDPRRRPTYYERDLGRGRSPHHPRSSPRSPIWQDHRTPPRNADWDRHVPNVQRGRSLTNSPTRRRGPGENSRDTQSQIPYHHRQRDSRPMSPVETTKKVDSSRHDMHTHGQTKSASSLVEREDSQIRSNEENIRQMGSKPVVSCETPTQEGSVPMILHGDSHQGTKRNRTQADLPLDADDQEVSNVSGPALKRRRIDGDLLMNGSVLGRGNVDGGALTSVSPVDHTNIQNVPDSKSTEDRILTTRATPIEEYILPPHPSAALGSKNRILSRMAPFGQFPDARDNQAAAALPQDPDKSLRQQAEHGVHPSSSSIPVPSVGLSVTPRTSLAHRIYGNPTNGIALSSDDSSTPSTPKLSTSTFGKGLLDRVSNTKFTPPTHSMHLPDTNTLLDRVSGVKLSTNAPLEPSQSLLIGRIDFNQQPAANQATITGQPNLHFQIQDTPSHLPNGSGQDGLASILTRVGPRADQSSEHQVDASRRGSAPRVSYGGTSLADRLH